MNGLVSEATAIADVTRWLDSKKISPNQRTKSASEIEKLQECVVDGTLVIDENCTITHNLMFPKENLKTLNYKNRATSLDFEPYRKNVAASDVYGQLKAIAAGLTETSNGIIATLDSEDLKITQAIAVFFM